MYVFIYIYIYTYNIYIYTIYNMYIYVCICIGHDDYKYKSSLHAMHYAKYTRNKTYTYMQRNRYKQINK